MRASQGQVQSSKKAFWFGGVYLARRAPEREDVPRDFVRAVDNELEDRRGRRRAASERERAEDEDVLAHRHVQLEVPKVTVPADAVDEGLRFGDVDALPTTFNLKPNHCSSHGHLARGAVRFLHWKDKTRTSRRKEVCSIINANTTARLILGLPDAASSKCLRIDGVASTPSTRHVRSRRSKCGMHGEEPVRLKRLKRPWVDQD